MLKKRKYQKWAQDQAELEKVDLKEAEKPMPALKKVERVRSFLTILKIDKSHFFSLVRFLYFHHRLWW